MNDCGAEPRTILAVKLNIDFLEIALPQLVELPQAAESREKRARYGAQRRENGPKHGP